MSEVYSESCNAESPCAAEIRKDNTARMAAIALGTALRLSLVGAYNLNRDVKLVTNSQVPYIEQRLDSMTPGLMATAREKKFSM
jgi:hypothetical protein